MGNKKEDFRGRWLRKFSFAWVIIQPVMAHEYTHIHDLTRSTVTND